MGEVSGGKGGGAEVGKGAKDVEKHDAPDLEKQQKTQLGEGWRYPKPSWLKRILFLDTDSLIHLGYRTRLEPEHMYADPGLNTKLLYGNLDAAWKEQLLKPKPDLKRALLRGNVGGLVITGILYGLAQACSLAGPLLLRRIVQGLQCQSAQRKLTVDIGCEPNSQLYFYIIGLFLAPALQSLCENQQMFLLYRLGTRMRNALMAAIYRKCLRLSNAAIQAESTGKVVTLMSNDAQKLQDAMFAIHAMWGSPAYIVAVLVLLWFEVGWATFVGLGVMLVMVPMTGKLAMKLGMLRREIIQWTDKRVGRMNELVNGIQMIKFYAWEKSFRAAVEEARGQEARILRRTALWQGVFSLLLFYGPVAVALFCFGSYAIAGETLTPASAYTALALFSLLRFPMSFLPMLITMIINALVAIKRIQGFLKRDESSLEPWDPEVTPVGHVTIRNGAFSWDAPSTAKPADAVKPADGTAAPATKAADGAATANKGADGAATAPPKPADADGTASSNTSNAADAAAAVTAASVASAAASADGAATHPHPDAEQFANGAVGAGQPTIEGIELDARPGTLTMVVGGVGCGKSSLLNALIGHIARVGGEVAVGGRIAYVAQTAWIMNDTLQENVLMGNPIDAGRYRAALEAAQLGPDLSILPNGDLTEIGDRGITLSGGQKQRVSIARAIYDDADVYLLDDPLSAVDSHVGRALFEQVIRGLLRSKTVLLVTNALQYLPHADSIIWMEGGRVRAQGTYNQLQEEGLNIAELCHDEAHDSEEGKDQTTDGSKMAPTPPPPAPTKEAAAAAVVAAAGKEAADVAAGKSSGADGTMGGKITLTRAGQDANRNLTGIETRESGAISGNVISLYFKAGGGWAYFIPLFILFGVEQGARVYTDTWVGNWFGNRYNQSTGFYLGIYAMMGLVYGLCTLLRSITFLFFCVRAAVSIHNQLLDHILELPKSFFDTNPAGRILNRFSRDTDIMDATLAASLIQFAGAVATYVSILIVITIATRWFGIALVPLTIIYFTIQRYYIPAARELQRIESISRSPIYSRFAEALNGVSTIRAYRAEGHFTAASDDLMERNAWAFVTQKLAAGWLACRLDMLGLTVLTLAGALCIQGGIEPGMAGLALVYALDLTRFLKHGTNMASKSEADFNSVERIAQYLEPEPEAAPETPPEILATLPADWPAAGAIVVEDLSMRYRPEMPLVLRGVSFSIAAGEKVGLVGRTGSGKSSMLLALFRMVEPEGGRILIDGVDIASLGLRHLRSRMSIIPQDPFMFNGTVRHNLDPFNTAQDHELWAAIEAVGLRAAIYSMGEEKKEDDPKNKDKKKGGGSKPGSGFGKPAGSGPSASAKAANATAGSTVVVDVGTHMSRALEAHVVDGGANFSLGQRQLFCLARAMLRKSRILMLDEATASVDVDTDNQIQGALRLQFGDCTCLTIAHRLNTIMDADRVVVLEAGRVVENDEPAALLEKEEGFFTGLVDQTGRNASRYLKHMARTASTVRAEVAASGSSRATAVERIRSLFHTNASFAARIPNVGSKSRLADMAGAASGSETPIRMGTVDLQMVEEDVPKSSADEKSASGNGRGKQ